MSISNVERTDSIDSHCRSARPVGLFEEGGDDEETYIRCLDSGRTIDTLLMRDPLIGAQHDAYKPRARRATSRPTPHVAHSRR